MKIGCVKEVKHHEYRVGLTPSDVKSYISRGHSVMIQKNAGNDAGFEDSEYMKAGAEIISGNKEVYNKAEMIIKVKEPVPAEYDLLQKNQILFTYLHLAADRKLTETLMKKGVKAVAYETIEDEEGQTKLVLLVLDQ